MNAIDKNNTENSCEDAVFLRFKFSKLEELKFLSHLDILGVVSRALLRTGLQIKFDHGFNPKPKIALSNPIPLGVESIAEYCDVELGSDIDTENFIKLINGKLPDLLPATGAEKTFTKLPNVMSQVDLVLYEFVIRQGKDFKAEKNNIASDFKDWLSTTTEISGSIYSFEIRDFRLEVYGYAKTFKEKNNSIFKFNIFRERLDDFLKKSNLDLKSVRKKELYVLKDGKLFSPLEII
jgi:radical SAM-linked protein